MLPDAIIDWIEKSWNQLIHNVLTVQAMLQGWTLFQFLVIAFGFAFSLWVGRLIEPPLEEKLRTIRQQPRLLRFLAILLRRMHWIIFTLFLWSVYLAMREVTWYSRSYFIGVAVSLVTAWLIISVASRVVRNRIMARGVAITAWTLAALNILGLLSPVVTFLDSHSFGVGDAEVTLWAVTKGVLSLVVLLWAASAASHFLEQRIGRSDELTPSLQVLVSKISKVLLVSLAIFVALTSMGVDLTALAVFGGALGLGIGFGLQKVVSNLFSGIIILLDKSIKPGDVISLGETFGWITTLRARYVSVVTRDGREYLIPNEDFITQQVINWSFSSRLIRLETTFGISYDNDPHQVRTLAIEAAKTVDRVVDHPEPVCHLAAFGESSLDFVLRFWIRDPEKGVMNVRGLVLLAVWDAFKKEGIKIPYPHRELVLRQPVEVRQQAGRDTAKP